ncbi:GNAT family N-acetyltransferase [Oceanobacillus picturae]|uniref:GNAT family N-acetyltransferase n=1 Tax=Oceanobacillus picturae TaxID=171693 RepID=UPI000E67F2C6|nr:GNAT family N-acetyltransferase [Oceanobacillus picturae]RIU89055.1 GNAT family N-acetyltransferase [Oceanobacillus picturae]
MNWHTKAFSELTTTELYKLLKARTDVFVVEQNCAYPELDNLDQESMHLYLEEEGEVAALVRIIPAGNKYTEASIGRVMVVNKFRGKGYARDVMEKALQFITEEWKESRIKIQAQEYLKAFYQSFGFKQMTEPYLDDGILHIDMIWESK